MKYGVIFVRHKITTGVKLDIFRRLNTWKSELAIPHSVSPAHLGITMYVYSMM